jgi:hypothetical protein
MQIKMYGYVVDSRQETDGNIKLHMRLSCWITNTTDTHSEYVILIASSQQHYLG